MKKNGIKLFEADSLDGLNDKVSKFMEETQYEFTDIKLNIVELSNKKVYMSSVFYMKNKNKNKKVKDVYFIELKKHTNYNELSEECKKAVYKDLSRIKAESKNKYETVIRTIVNVFMNSSPKLNEYYEIYRGKIDKDILRLAIRNQTNMNYDGIDGNNVHIDGDDFLKEYAGICNWLLMYISKLNEEKKSKK